MPTERDDCWQVCKSSKQIWGRRARALQCDATLQVVILGRPHDPEASKLVVDACATLLAWSKRIGALVTQDGSRPLAAKALCAVHRGALRLQRDSLTTQLQDPPTLIATGPAMRQLRLQLARAEPGLLMASQGMRRAARAAGHGALLHGASRPTPGHAALQDGAPPHVRCVHALVQWVVTMRDSLLHPRPCGMCTSLS